MNSLRHSVWWSRFTAVGLPFFREARRKALGGLVLLVIPLLAINGMNVVNSYVGRDFMTALADRYGRRFFFLAGALAGVFAASTVIEVFARYAEQWLGLVWRGWLTRRFLDRYLAGRAFLRLADQHDVDNPEERIALDVKTFTATTLSILVLLVNGIVTVLAFSGVLWLITPWLFLAALGYALAGSIGTLWLGRHLIALNNQQLEKEADFRHGLGQVRERPADVAPTAGHDQRARLDRWLTAIMENFRIIIRLTRNLGFFTVAYKYLPQIIPAMIVAPLYFRGTVQFGTVTQAAMAFSQVQGAFSLFVVQFQEVATYAAVTERLGGLWMAISSEAAEQESGGRRQKSEKSRQESAATDKEPETGHHE